MGAFSERSQRSRPQDGESNVLLHISRSDYQPPTLIYSVSIRESYGYELSGAIGLLDGSTTQALVLGLELSAIE